MKIYDPYREGKFTCIFCLGTTNVSYTLKRTKIKKAVYGFDDEVLIPMGYQMIHPECLETLKEAK